MNDAPHGRESGRSPPYQVGHLAIANLHDTERAIITPNDIDREKTRRDSGCDPRNQIRHGFPIRRECFAIENEETPLRFGDEWFDPPHA
jgi:hypothetical protein